MRATFTISGRLPGLNDILKTARTNRFAAAGEKKRLTAACAKAARAAGLGDLRMPGPARVTFRWVEKDRRRDVDNVAAAGTKVILDGLVDARVLEGDGRRHVREIHHEFPEPDAQNPRVEVTIETLEGGHAHPSLFPPSA